MDAHRFLQSSYDTVRLLKTGIELFVRNQPEDIKDLKKILGNTTRIIKEK